MIHKLVFNDGRIEFTQSKGLDDLNEKYREYDPEEYLNINEIIEISEEKAKTIILTNDEYDEEDKSEDALPELISLFDLVVGDEFLVVKSTDLWMLKY